MTNIASFARLSHITRSEGDPKVLQSGPSSSGVPDGLAKALGWFSLGLGLTELLAPGASRRRSEWKARRVWCASTALAR